MSSPTILCKITHKPPKMKNTQSALLLSYFPDCLAQILWLLHLSTFPSNLSNNIFSYCVHHIAQVAKKNDLYDSCPNNQCYVIFFNKLWLLGTKINELPIATKCFSGTT